jgi:putrescine---pyruvate transaminase
MASAALQRLDALHLHVVPGGNASRRDGGRPIVSGDGVWIRDAEGRALLDALSGLWCVNVGYGRDELVDAAVRQMRALPCCEGALEMTTPTAERLAAHLLGLAPPGFAEVSFAASSSEANDAAIGIIRRYWALRGQPQKQIVIARRGAYHGSTIAGASMGGIAAMHDQLPTPLHGFHHVMPPYTFAFAEPGEDAAAFGLRAAREIEAAILEIGPERVAAVVGEPVMGAGGVCVPPATYWPEVERICRHFDVLLHADEAITAFGRLGHWFGCDAFGFVPDVITVGKALTSGYQPMAAILLNQRIAETLQDGAAFFDGYADAAHPVACAVARANLDILEREGLVERVRDDIGPYFASALAGLADHPLVGEVRCLGLMGALELVADQIDGGRLEDAGALGARCRELGLAEQIVLRADGDTMVVAPPLVIGRAEVDELVVRCRRVLDEALGELQARPASLPFGGDSAR